MNRHTVRAIKRQLTAMGASRYEVSVLKTSGKMLKREWNIDTTLKSAGFLAKQNVSGAHIYVRPAGDENQGIILIDDLSRGALAKMESDGITPSCVVETSEMNYQAWVRLSDRQIKAEIATGVSRYLAQQYEADKNSTDWRHIGRLAGFTNRKLHHIDEHGRYPFVTIWEATGKSVDRARVKQLISDSEQHIAEYRDQKAQERESTVTIKDEPIITKNPTRGVDQDAERLYECFEKQRDRSVADYLVAARLLEAGHPMEAVRNAIEVLSPDVDARKRGHVRDYTARTVLAAARKIKKKERECEFER